MTLLAGAFPARADFAAGNDAFARGDYDTAFREWAPLAKTGDARAQLGLGALYESGQGVPAPDLAQAVAWYRAAAAQGLPAAQNNLAILYADGRGVPRNPVMAGELWQAAAAAGHPLAQFNLALAFERGVGVARDYYDAARWYAEAGNSGQADAAFALSEMYRTGRGIPRHAELARLWHEAAQQLGGSLKLRQDFIAVLPPRHAVAAKPAAPAAQPTAPPTPPEAEPAAGPLPAADPAGAFAVQLASLPSEAEAAAAGGGLKARYPDLLGAVALQVRRADLGDKGIWYRVLAGPFAARKAATDLCARLHAAATPADCLVVGVK
ncbi:MAG: SPOR domain-containing protein [Dongiaceae bacterium]